MSDILQGGPDLVGMMEIASDILTGIYEPISDVFGESTDTYWDLYNSITPA